MTGSRVRRCRICRRPMPKSNVPVGPTCLARLLAAAGIHTPVRLPAIRSVPVASSEVDEDQLALFEMAGAR